MIDEQVAIEDVLGIYAVSNTPGFLFSRLRELESIQRLARNPSERLIARFEEIASAPIPTPREAAIAYAILSSLSFKQDHRVREFASNPSGPNLEWADDIKRRIAAAQRADFSSTVDLSRPAIISTFPTSVGTTTTR